MPFKERRQVVLAKLEDVEGTDAQPGVEDAIPLAAAPSFTAGVEFENLNEDAHHGGLGMFDELEDAGEYGELTLEFWLRGKADGETLAAEKPEADALLQVSGAAVAVDATAGTESVEYTWGLSTDEPSATIYWHEDGLLHKLLGTRARASFLFEAGRPVRATMVCRGLHSWEDAPFPDVQFGPVPKPPVVRNSAFALDGWDAIWSRLQIDLNTEFGMRPGPAAADAILPYIIGEYRPTMGLDPEVVSVATYDVRGKWKSKDGLAMSLGPLGSAVGNRITVAAPRTQLRVPGTGARNLYRTFDLTCGLKVDQGDDFLTITFS